MKRILLFLALICTLNSYSQNCVSAGASTVTLNSTTSVTISFTQVMTNVNAIQIYYVRNGFTDTTSTPPSLSTSVTITALSANTPYSYFIRTFCTSGNFVNTAIRTFSTTQPPTTYTPMTANGYSFKRGAFDATLHVPFVADTALYQGLLRPGAIVCRVADSLFYGWNGKKWALMGADVASLMTKINGKVDSVTTSLDTIFYWKSGVSYGSVLSAGGGSGGSLSGGNLGNGFRLYKPSSSGIYTLFNKAGTGTTIDSTTNTNGITIGLDTSLASTKVYVNFKDDIQQEFINYRKLNTDSVAASGYRTNGRAIKDSSFLRDLINTNTSSIATKLPIADTTLLLRKTSNALLTLNAPNLASTQDATKGILLANTFPSTAGVPVQISPAIILEGHAWNTGAGGTGVNVGDNTMQWQIEVIPVSGAGFSAIDNKLVFSQKHGTATTFSDVATFTKSGIIANLQQNSLTLGTPGTNGSLILNRSDGLEVGRLDATPSSFNIISSNIQLITLGSSANGMAYYTETGLWVGINGVTNQTPLSRLVVAGGANANVSIGSNIAAPENGLAVVGETKLSSKVTMASASANNYVVNQKPLYVSTTDATATELTLDGAAGSGATNRISVPTNGAMSVVVNICVKQQGSANSKQMLRQFLITNNAGTTSIEGTVTALGTDVGSTALLAAAVTITANTANNCIKIEGTGILATNLRWTANIVSTEVIY